MAMLMNIDTDDRQRDDVIEDVLSAMWRSVNELLIISLPTSSYSHYSVCSVQYPSSHSS